MRKEELKSKLTEMMDSLDEIISGAGERASALNKFVKCRSELKELLRKLDEENEVDWLLVMMVMYEVIDCVYSFSSS